VACDVSDRDAVCNLVAAIPGLTGIVHAAGVLDDGVISSLTAHRLDRVLAAKADAAWYLHEATAERSLNLFVCYSSESGVLGAPGQGNYAAANTFLDALASYRRDQGLPAHSIAWGPWATSSGMADQMRHADLARIERTGFAPLTVDEGLRLFDRVISHRLGNVVAATLSNTALRAQARSGQLHALLHNLIPTSTHHTPSTTIDLPAKLAGLDSAEQLRIITDFVRTQAAIVLGHDSATKIDPDRQFQDLGFDSLSAIEFRNRLRDATKMTLPATVVFDYPTPRELAAYLCDKLRPEEPGSPNGDVLGEIERWEADLVGACADQQMGVRILSRLETVVAKCRASVQPGDQRVRETLSSAPAEEVLDFISKELGIN
jgi:acyl carrier protein